MTRPRSGSSPPASAEPVLCRGTGSHRPRSRGGRPRGPDRVLAPAAREFVADPVPEIVTGARPAGRTGTCCLAPGPGGPFIGRGQPERLGLRPGRSLFPVPAVGCLVMVSPGRWLARGFCLLPVRPSRLVTAGPARPHPGHARGPGLRGRPARFLPGPDPTVPPGRGRPARPHPGHGHARGPGLRGPATRPCPPRGRVPGCPGVRGAPTRPPGRGPADPGPCRRADGLARNLLVRALPPRGQPSHGWPVRGHPLAARRYLLHGRGNHFLSSSGHHVLTLGRREDAPPGRCPPVRPRRRTWPNDPGRPRDPPRGRLGPSAGAALGRYSAWPPAGTAAAPPDAAFRGRSPRSPSLSPSSGGRHPGASSRPPSPLPPRPARARSSAACPASADRAAAAARSRPAGPGRLGPGLLSPPAGPWPQRLPSRAGCPPLLPHHEKLSAPEQNSDAEGERREDAHGDRSVDQSQAGREHPGHQHRHRRNGQEGTGPDHVRPPTTRRGAPGSWLPAVV